MANLRIRLAEGGGSTKKKEGRSSVLHHSEGRKKKKEKPCVGWADPPMDLKRKKEKGEKGGPGGGKKGKKEMVSVFLRREGKKKGREKKGSGINLGRDIREQKKGGGEEEGREGPAWEKKGKEKKKVFNVSLHRYKRKGEEGEGRLALSPI